MWCLLNQFVFEQISAIVNDMDENDDGEIDFVEFVKIVDKLSSADDTVRKSV